MADAPRYVVSSCLAGLPRRHDGGSNICAAVSVW